MVKAFYEETPFPNYDDLDSRESLIAKSRQGLFAAALDEQFPDRAIVLEAGCGKLEEKLRAAAPGFDWDHRSLFSEHHLSHAASAFFSSPFEHAVILTMDGVGEWAATSAGMGDQNRITMLKEIHFPHSLGLLYSAFTYFRDSGLIRANARSWGLHLMVNPALLDYPRSPDRSEGWR